MISVIVRVDIFYCMWRLLVCLIACRLQSSYLEEVFGMLDDIHGHDLALGLGRIPV
jgi:hypothetical protein